MKLGNVKNWKVIYDKGVDELFVGQYPQPNGVENNYYEGVLYAIKDKQIVGFFIEYFKSQIDR